MGASRRSAGVRFELGRLGAVLTCVTGGGAAALLLDSLEDGGRIALMPAVAIKLGVLFALALCLWFGALERDERAHFGRWLRARLART